MKTKRIYLVALVMIMLITAGCSKKPKVTSVVVSPTQVAVSRSETSQFKAMVEGKNNPSQEVSWTVQGGINGTIIDSNGLLSIASDEMLTTLTITATSTVDPRKSSIANVTVLSGITDINITRSTSSLIIGQTQQFNAVVLGKNNPPQDVIWIVTGGVSGTRIDDSGLLMVSSDETAKTLSISVASIADPSKKRDISISVVIPFVVRDISSWNNAINIIRNAGNNQRHTISVENDITIPLSLEQTFGNLSNITVNIQGNHTITGNPIGCLLYIGAQQTVIIKDITLQNREARSYSDNLMTCYLFGQGATLRMEGKAKITGNISGIGIKTGNNTVFTMQDNSVVSKNSTGVEAYGTFTMLDNASVSENTNGIFSYGAFTMQDKASVSNNTAGSVSIGQEDRLHFTKSTATFTMKNNSTVSHNRYSVSVCGTFMMQDNSSVVYAVGRGVSIQQNGVFIMQDEASVSNNTGGGVYSMGTFTMKGNSKVSNNTLTGSSFSNFLAKGGGVFIEYGSFTLENGTISGNLATSQGNGYSNAHAYGGGVYAGGSFTMKNGTISNNTANGVKASLGGGVYSEGGFNMQGGIISGNICVNSALGGGCYGGIEKTGGTIYGNESSQTLRNIATNGKGHAIHRYDKLWRNVTAGETDNSSGYGFWAND